MCHDLKLLSFCAVVDFAIGVRNAINMMEPMSFTMVVVRNLSCNWCKDIPELNISGHLKSVEVRF